MLYWTLDCFEQETLANLCESPELLSELAQFDIQLPKVDFSGLASASESMAQVAAETAIPTSNDESQSADSALPLVLAMSGGVLIASVVVWLIILRRRNNSKKTHKVPDKA
jgi:hypothetical protein